MHFEDLKTIFVDSGSRERRLDELDGRRACWLEHADDQALPEEKRIFKALPKR